jgi:hypothetical protein
MYVCRVDVMFSIVIRTATTNCAQSKNGAHGRPRTLVAAALPDEEIEGDILNALLREQRIVVIVDRLSERSAATQAHIAGIYASTRVEALVIATRIEMRPVGSNPISLYPQPLNASNLIKFMCALLED